VGQRHAPRLADGLVAARQADVAQVGRPAKVLVIADQELAAPDRPIGAVAGAVERDPEDRPGQPVLGHATGHVRMVVLHGKQLDALPGRALPGVARRGVVRVQVVGQHLRPDLLSRQLGRLPGNLAVRRRIGKENG